MYCYCCNEGMKMIGPGVFRCERCGLEERDTSREMMLKRCQPVSLKAMKHADSVPDSILLHAKNGRIKKMPPRDNVREICFANNVFIIEKGAFEGFSSLESVSFPDTLTEIRKRAFYGCKKLHTAYLPAGIRMVGSRAFRKTKVRLHVPPPFAFISPKAFPKFCFDPIFSRKEDWP